MFARRIQIAKALLQEKNSYEIIRKKLKVSFLSLPILSDPIPLSLYLKGSEIYRLGRKKGLTIRSSTDCLIAAIAIANSTPVWHDDRDFDNIAQFTELKIF